MFLRLHFVSLKYLSHSGCTRFTLKRLGVLSLFDGPVNKGFPVFFSLGDEIFLHDVIFCIIYF